MTQTLFELLTQLKAKKTYYSKISFDWLDLSYKYWGRNGDGLGFGDPYCEEYSTQTSAQRRRLYYANKEGRGKRLALHLPLKEWFAFMFL